MTTTRPPSVSTLARRFRALWVFRQALAALAAAVPEAPRFTALQARLRQLARETRGSGESAEELRAVSRDLDTLAADLLAADAAVTPAQLRHFLQRAASYDEVVLLQLVEVYLDDVIRTADGTRWPPARLDKLGYVLTRLAERRLGAGARALAGLDERGRLRDLFAWIWPHLGKSADAAAVDDGCRALETMRDEIGRVGSLAELRAGRVVSRYRECKEQLGDTLFHPDVLVAALETNLRLKEVVHELYRREEARIFTDSELVLELEADLTEPADPALRDELDRFHEAVLRFEEQLRADDLKIDEAADLQAQARGLIERIGP